MGLLAKEKLSDFKLLEPGTHLAICNAVIGVGLQQTIFGSKEKVYIRWEVPAERVQYEKDGEQVNLPMHGEVSSLNVSVATGVCLYEAVRQRDAAGP